MNTKVARVFNRPDNSQVRVTAQVMFGSGLHASIDVMVHRRLGDEEPWDLLSGDFPQGFKEMSRADYMLTGRPDKFKYASIGELLGTINMLGLS